MKKKFFLLSVLFVLSFSQKAKCQSREDPPLIDKRNTLSIQPIIWGKFGKGEVVGSGIEFERKISQALSIEIPIQYFFPYLDNEGISLGPRLKIYPYKKEKPVVWSIGPGIRYSKVNYFEGWYLDGNYYKTEYSPNTDVLGFEMHNGLNVSAKHLYFNVTSTLGINCIPSTTAIFINSMSIGIHL